MSSLLSESKDFPHRNRDFFNNIGGERDSIATAKRPIEFPHSGRWKEPSERGTVDRNKRNADAGQPFTDGSNALKD
jgi:hypothetical protein